MEPLPHPAPAPGPLRLTHAGVPVLFESGGAHAPPDRHQPLPLGAAVHFGRVPLFGVIHTLTPDLHQRGGVGARHHVGEHRQVAADAHAAFVVHAHGGEGDAGADVLEGQVEASLGEGADAAHLRGAGATAQGQGQRSRRRLLSADEVETPQLFMQQLHQVQFIRKWQKIV